MGNSLRCCLACVLPCGALDVIRIVHLNGHVEEYSRHVSAGEILAANPKHVISKPCSEGVTHSILILSPDSELKRGGIYFLIPESSLPEKKKRKNKSKSKQPKKSNCTTHEEQPVKVIEQDGFLEKVVSEKSKSGHHRRRSSRVAVWRPHLESITEDQ